MRLDKYLADCGAGSRKETRTYIRDGRVTVNGVVAKREAQQVQEEADHICLDGVELLYRRYLYLMLNKPAGVVSATQDRQYKTVLDLVPPQYRHFDLFPVGRLDIDTTGLLLLTNDGALAHRLTSPRHHADKIYYAEIAGVVGDEDRKQFREGILLEDGYRCKPAELCVLESGALSTVCLTIQEGKFHQVKRMFEAVGKRVLSLKRLAMGGVRIDESLREGEVRLLTEQEIALLKQI